jgi:pyridoxal phosphate enzyme (YggS family)
MSVAENIAKIEERIQKACDNAGRKRDEVILMGVTKFVAHSSIKEAYTAGVHYFGESRVKEAAEKFEGFKNDHKNAQLHLVGSLQRNKAGSAALLFDCIQSVDRDELIIELKKRLHLRSLPLEVLLELHTGEESKNGFTSLDALFRAAEMVLSCEKLKPMGLMTMAPFTTDAQLIRSSFRKLVKAQEELKKRFMPANGDENSGGWACLSMGMSNDFEIAIEEGSTLLRIGSAIFKE